MSEKILVTRSSMPPFEEYIEMIRPLWKSRWLTNMGTYHQQFETELCNYFNVQNVSLMVNGHMSLEMAIQAMEFPRGSEVITTPFTFISTTHAIVRNGLTPIFCDVKLSDGTIDENKIESLITEKTVAIIPVHVYGNICNLEEIDRIAYKYGLKVIYDACHAFGVKYKGKGIANFGDASVFSFHATKVFNTIEGGAVACNNHALYEKLYNLKNFGIRGEELVVQVGANAKMNEFSAAMGLCNLKHLEEEIQKRKNVMKKYCKELKNISGVSVLTNNNVDFNQNYAYLPIVIEEEKLGKKRDDVYNLLRQNDIYARKYFYPLTADQACFRNKYCNTGIHNARWLAEHILVLPFYSDLPFDAIERIIDVIKS